MSDEKYMNNEPVDENSYICELCADVKRSSYEISQASPSLKNRILETIAEKITCSADRIERENDRDIEAARSGGMSSSMLDRLKFGKNRILACAQALRDIENLPDPCGTGTRTVRPNGLAICRIRVPLGVCAIIYEARPNVTLDAAALCIKSGNAVILRGGKEAICTNKILAELIGDSIEECGLPRSICRLVEVTSRSAAQILMKQRGYVDVLIPRGGRGLIQSVVQNATVPVIETGAGNCHIYIEKSCRMDRAVEIAVNAKCSRPSVCNAAETVLADREIAPEFFRKFYEATRKYNLEIRGDEQVRGILPEAVMINDDDFAHEYNDYIIAAGIVDGIDEAVAHIRKYGTGHSEAIVTENLETARKFQTQVDAAAVYVNASTRFTDGGEFGLGAEIGISTQKLHARGPMGLMQLTTDKYLVEGDGQIRV